MCIMALYASMRGAVSFFAISMYTYRCLMVMGVSAGCPNIWCKVCIDHVPNQMREILGDGVQLA